MFQRTATSPLVKIYSSSKGVGKFKKAEKTENLSEEISSICSETVRKKSQTKKSWVSWNTFSCSPKYAYLLELQLAGLMVELLVFLMASQLASVMGPLWAFLKASLEIDVRENKQNVLSSMDQHSLLTTGQNS